MARGGAARGSAGGGVWGAFGARVSDAQVRRGKGEWEDVRERRREREGRRRGKEEGYEEMA